MTIAEIHGKLSPHRPNGCNDRMEDLLTSDVFGTMKYAGWECGFMDWLRSALNAREPSTAQSLIPPNEAIERIHYRFWPRLDNNREPDLILGIELTDGDLFLVMIEVKYFSGTSDSDNEANKERPEDTGNQLAAQVNGFPKKFLVQGKDCPVQGCCHIFITTHFSRPDENYDKAKQHIANDIPMFWVSWHTLPDFLRRHEHVDVGKQEMIKDLLTLLERKGLIPFKGISPIPQEDYAKYMGQRFWKAKKRGWWETAAPYQPTSGHFWR